MTDIKDITEGSKIRAKMVDTLGVIVTLEGVFTARHDEENMLFGPRVGWFHLESGWIKSLEIEVLEAAKPEWHSAHVIGAVHRGEPKRRVYTNDHSGDPDNWRCGVGVKMWYRPSELTDVKILVGADVEI